mmetsp:Transcript_12687/g.29214  ORF Transcript_12687/g.29214 Transcript_12687/m.29214 type:complete len:244 (+) Transcript_12687:2437-3168(+)
MLFCSLLPLPLVFAWFFIVRRLACTPGTSVSSNSRRLHLHLLRRSRAIARLLVQRNATMIGWAASARVGKVLDPELDLQSELVPQQGAREGRDSLFARVPRPVGEQLIVHPLEVWIRTLPTEAAAALAYDQPPVNLIAMKRNENFVSPINIAASLEHVLGKLSGLVKPSHADHGPLVVHVIDLVAQFPSVWLHQLRNPTNFVGAFDEHKVSLREIDNLRFSLQPHALIRLAQALEERAGQTLC